MNIKLYKTKRPSNGKTVKSESNQLLSFLLLAIGLAGLVSLTLDKDVVVEANQTNTVEMGIPINSQAEDVAIGIPNDKWIESKIERVRLQIPNVYPETNTPLVVNIKNFDSKLPIAVDFGDGTLQQITSERLSHYYQATGDYTVKLVNLKNNKVQQVLPVVVSSPVQEGF